MAQWSSGGFEKVDRQMLNESLEWMNLFNKANPDNIISPDDAVPDESDVEKYIINYKN